MKRTFKTELRSADGERWLEGVILQEGRAAGKLPEVFAPGSVRWPSDGIGIQIEHGAVETRAFPSRDRQGRISIRTRATPAIQAAVAAGATGMSVEFVAVEERTTEAGVREVLNAIVDRAAVCRNPIYDSTRAEVRAWRRRRRRVFL